MRKAKIKTLLLLATVALMVFALAVSADAFSMFGPAGGQSTIFPYIVKDDPNVVTLISIVNTSACVGDVEVQLHYVYYHKPISAAQTAACDEYDLWGRTSPNDLLTFDASGYLGGGLPVLGDETSSPLVKGSTLALTVPKSEGWLLVESVQEEPGLCDIEEPYGEALILDLANGGAWGYPSFSDWEYRDEAAYLGKKCGTPAIVQPPALATTKFMVTPISFSLIYDADKSKKFTGVVQMLNKGAEIYDRNENTLSSTLEKKVKCYGTATLDELLSTGIQNNPAFVASGGWGWFVNKEFKSAADGTFDYMYSDMLVYKVESSSASALGGKFMSNGVPLGASCYPWFGP